MQTKRAYTERELFFLLFVMKLVQRWDYLVGFEIFKIILMEKQSTTVLLPSQRYDFISETVTPENLTRSKQKCKLSPVGHNR